MGEYKKAVQNNKFKMSALTWNEEFELPDGSYSVSEFQYYFKYILTVTDNPSIRTYVNEIQNRFTFKITFNV